jgi:CheY-like chemotaxis protein
MSRPNDYVLLAEDNDDLRTDLAELLREEGYRVVVASNGRVALDALAQALPGLVLLDLMMPVIDGRHVRAEMLKDPLLARVPVVVLTGAPIDDAAELRAEAIIQKPFGLESVLRYVAAYCSRG